MAINGKLVAPSIITSATFGNTSGPWANTIAALATTASATAIGTLIRTSASKPRNMNNIIIRQTLVNHSWRIISVRSCLANYLRHV